MRRKQVLLGGLVVLVLVAVSLATRATAQEDLDVLKVIPENYKLVLDNAFVRVIEARIPPGSVEPPHRHLRGVSVCMDDYVIEHLAHPGGSWSRSARKLGDVYWSESSVHQTRNVGTTPSHTIRIELKF
jgi:beta-alanine degradation protein BauB